MDLALLEGAASERMLACLKKINDSEPDAIRHGLEELTSLTKRSDDVSECLDLCLKAQLLPKMLEFFKAGLSTEYEGEVSVRGLSPHPVTVPLGEAIQLAACTALGELIWQRDTSSEVRPVLLEVGGMAALASLLADTTSERVRLKVLVLTRRVMYEVGSTSVMDPAALVAAKECDLMGVLVGLLERAVSAEVENVTVDTLEGLTYLFQRMQVCMTPEQKEDSGLTGHLRHAATTFTSLLRTNVNREALEIAILGLRELCWDDHNETLEPAISQFAEVGTFEAIAALLAPPVSSGRQSCAGEFAPPLALLAAVEAGSVNKAVVGSACALLERLAAAKPGILPPSLEMQVPRLFHQVIYQLVDQLDHSLHAPDRQEVALLALRKLLVTDNTQHISKPAAEAADAEGVPARLLAVAQSGSDFGGPGDIDGGEGAPAATARAAAALLADLTASTAVLAAEEGRPAQAADALQVVEALVAPLIGQLDNDVDACRTFCKMLYSLSVIRYDSPSDSEGEEEAYQRVAPPDEEQYALSSQLVTMVGKAAQGLTALIQGGYVSKPRPTQAAVASPLSPARMARMSTAEAGPGLTAESSASGLATAETLQHSVSLLQRATLLMHELAGLKPQMNSMPISRHNIEALFVHGTFQALVTHTYQFYVNKRNMLRAQARAEAEAAAATANVVDDEAAEGDPQADLEKSPDDLPPFIISLSRASSMSANQNPLLHALLNQETGALELLKELVRDCAEARIKLRDVGALPHFARMLNDNPRDNLLVSLQFNLARSEALHAALRQEGCIALMDKVLAQAPQQLDGAQHEVRRLLSLCVLGLVASDSTSTLKNDSDLQSRRAAMLLEKNDMPGVMEKVLRDACRDGRYVINNSTSAWPFTLEPAAFTAQCLARCDTTARKLCERKIPSMLLGALRNKHGAAPEPALRIVRALLNFARLPDLRADLLALGAADDLLPYTISEDLRTCDAARGCLLQLGELPELPARVALQATLPESLAPVLSQALPATFRSSEAGGPCVEPVYDVLISYKRQDAHALARALHTTLVLRGIGCLLDYEYQSDLSDVPQVVARARNLILILTDNCLTSPRCLAELTAAANYDVNVIMVVKEGARWGDSNGNMLSVPPQQTIKAMWPELHKLFSVKAVQHRDEHYAYFVTQLLKRVKVAAAASKPTTPPGTARGSKLNQSVSMIRKELTIGLSRAASSKQRTGTLPSSPPNEPASGQHATLSFAPRVSQGHVPPAVSAADFQALSAAVAAQTTMLSELVSEFATVKAAAANMSGVQQAVQSLQGEMAVLRREMAAEVLANGRQVTGEVAAMSQQVRQAMAGESGSQGSAMASLKAEVSASLAGGMASLKAELTGSMGAQMRSLSSDVGELRRGLADTLSSLTGLQGQVRALAMARTEGGGGGFMTNGNGAVTPPGMLSRTAPPMLTAMHPGGALFHSGPVRPGDETQYSAGLQPISTGSNGSLPLIHTSSGTAANGANHNSKQRRSLNALPDKPPANVLPGGFAPNVGGFQGARIAAAQAKLNTVTRGRQ